MRLISKLEIKNGILVKGRKLEGNRKIGNPVEFAKKYYDQGIDEIYFFDIVASLYDRKIISDIINEISSKIYVPYAAGGGIKKLSDVKKLFDAGVDKVHLNSILFKNLYILDQFSEVYGSQSISVEVQVRKIDNDYFCFYDQGREFSKILLKDWISNLKTFDWGEIIITDIDRDGMYTGINMDLIKNLRDILPERQLLYSGGFNPKIDNLSNFRDYLDGLLVASALIDEKFDISNYSQRLLK